uniref:Phosphoinositide-3-kinase interacting protein 1 n=1 Tax=Anser cygnoides TaxID=8845 RepID=A0A8B9IP51_ANSCY
MAGSSLSTWSQRTAIGERVLPMHPTGEPGEPDRRVGRRMYSSELLLQGQWLFYSPRPSSGPAAALPMQPQPFSRLRGSGAVSPRSRSSADGAVRVPGSRPVPWRPPLPLRGLPTGAGSRQPPGGGSVRTRRRLRGGRGEGKRGGGSGARRLFTGEGRAGAGLAEHSRGCSSLSAPRMLRGAPRLGAVLLGSLLLASARGAEECLRGDGASYRGSRSVASGGAPCLNWGLAVRSGPGAELPAAAEDHNSCRNPDGAAAPWCYVRGADGVPERRPCDIAPCPDATVTTVPVPTAEVNISQEVNQVFEPADTLPSRSEAAAVQPVIGISQRVQMNSREKKDLGTLGYVLGLIMMVIIIAIGAGIVLGYIYKRGKDLKEKHEQKVYEREMQRITLPLSAFTNPASFQGLWKGWLLQHLPDGTEARPVQGNIYPHLRGIKPFK